MSVCASVCLSVCLSVWWCISLAGHSAVLFPGLCLSWMRNQLCGTYQVPEWQPLSPWNTFCTFLMCCASLEAGDSTQLQRTWQFRCMAQTLIPAAITVLHVGYWISLVTATPVETDNLCWRISHSTYYVRLFGLTLVVTRALMCLHPVRLTLSHSVLCLLSTLLVCRSGLTSQALTATHLTQHPCTTLLPIRWTSTCRRYGQWGVFASSMMRKSAVSQCPVGLLVRYFCLVLLVSEMLICIVLYCFCWCWAVPLAAASLRCLLLCAT